MLRAILHGIDAISEWSGKIFSHLLLAVILVLLYEIGSRYIFNAPTIWAHETTQHTFGAYSILAGAYVLLSRGHVKVDVIYMRLSQRGQAVLDSITYLLFFIFVIPIFGYGLIQAIDSIRIMETSFSPFAPPIWPLKTTVPIGALLILLQGIAHWIRALSMATRGKEIA